MALDEATVAYELRRLIEDGLVEEYVADDGEARYALTETGLEYAAERFDPDARDRLR